MSRRPRNELPDGLTHITCRTIRRVPLFHTERDARGYLMLLDHVTRDVVVWNVLAYCLMPNHVHLVVEASVDQLSLAMHRVNGLYAQRFNRTHGFRGHVFQGRFHAKPILDESHLPGSIRYVLLNPVRAGLCAGPEHWRWSSFRTCAGLERGSPFVALERTLAYFGDDLDKAKSRFCRFVQDGLERSNPRGLSPGLSPSVAAAPNYPRP